MPDTWRACLDRDVRGSWFWRCPSCGYNVLWIRDTAPGRYLVAALVRASERSQEDLMAEGMLSLHDSMVDGLPLICLCDDREGARAMTTDAPFKVYAPEGARGVTPGWRAGASGCACTAGGAGCRGGGQAVYQCVSGTDV